MELKNTKFEALSNEELMDTEGGFLRYLLYICNPTYRLLMDVVNLVSKSK